MPKLKRALVAALAALAVSGGLAAERATALPDIRGAIGALFKPKPKAERPPQPDQPTAPAAETDLPPDPALRFGILPNGMKYVLAHNATPPGQTSLRLRVDAGSLMEAEDQRGLAHFLEHMAFNGSTNVPEGEMVKILERAGLSFGADTNASTNFEQTVYELDLPRSDDATVDTALMLMRESVGSMTLDAGAIDRERGVVLSEERTRASPAYRILQGRYDFFLKGQLAPQRFPIGDTDVLKTAQRDRFLAFYNAYYRPERVTLVVVGDFDVAVMEAKIRSRFGDWRVSGPAGRAPDLGQIARRGVETHVLVEPGGPAGVQVAWINPPDLSADTRERRKARLVRELGFAVLNRRMESLARAANPPFIGAGAFRYTDTRSADITVLSVTGQPGQWKQNLTAAEQEQRRIVQFGVQQAELDREIAEYRTQLEAAVAGSATRRTAALAEGIVDSINAREVFTADDFDLALFEETVKGLKADKVTQELKAQFAGQGPLVLVTSPTPVEGGDAAVAAAFAESRQAVVTAPPVISVKAWPYDDWGPAGEVVSTRDVIDLDTTFVTFANGVRLTVKPTKFRDDQVLVQVRMGHGYLDLPRDRQALLWAAGLEYVEGGLGQMTAQELEQTLAATVYGASFSVDEDAFALSGRTRPQDLRRQLEVLAAYATDAAWRPEPFERVRTYGLSILDQLMSTPAGVFSREGEALLRSGDMRWRFPTQEEFRSARLDTLRAAIADPMSRGPVEVIIVGDVSVEAATEEVAATFGAMAPRPAAAEPPAEAAQVRFPAGVAQPVRLTHRGRPDQALGFVGWPGVDFAAQPQEARKLRMLQLVLELRLLDELRERQGVTYSPNTSLETAWAFPGYGYVSASVQAPPDKLKAFFDAVTAIARDLRDNPVTADELERARKPRLEQLMKAQVTNEYWLGQLEGAQTDPRRLDAIRATLSGLERITAADVQATARRYLTDDRAWKLEIVPEGTPGR
ncbi:MAG: insulinase family protein [Caulobacteraceae bacterium]|nr:insulinase family protein [Caulobacteraceae bacterium]